jgi:ABC-type cobalamin/Fe3+-siderophores transport system ATPase subunit
MFDVQSPELTVRETVLYSARLRLNPKEGNVATDDLKMKYVEMVLRKLELTKLADSLVGSDEEGGLSFEERKRLSIAVELAASPSIIFLDEPTSGLDARAATIVVRALRRIADSGRTVIATIHQPSLAVFEMFDELLLLQKGGRAVFFGELGPNCMNLTNYFELLGADPIDVGENPANWMLNVVAADGTPRDYAEEFVNSRNYSEMNQRIRVSIDDVTPEDEIIFDTEYATTPRQRQSLTNKRFLTIYFRSPAYNLSRIVISVCIAFILGSVFLANIHPVNFSETQIGSIFSTIFISFIITGVLAIVSVLPVMLKLRDSFYKHRAAGMVGPNSVALALGVAEKWFIVTSSVLFCIIFLGTSGLYVAQFRRLVSFWGFFTFNAAIYSYFGQAFMCLVREMGTAQILASVFIGLNNFFSGLIVRPQYLFGLFQFTYWLTPGHYVFEGMIISLFDEDERLVFATDNSQFFLDQGCSVNQMFACNGTVSDFVQSYFGGKFVESHILMNTGILAAYLVVARLATFLALKHFNFTS